MEDKISIIVPAHNAEKYIKKCLISIIKQDYKNKEIIVVINATTDNTLLICEQINKEFNCIKIINIDEAGVSNARNIGMQLASGNIIGFCDADDYIEEGTLKKINTAFKEENIDIVVFGYNTRDINGDILTKNLLGQKHLFNSLEFSSYVLLHPCILGSVCNKFFNSTIIEKYTFNCEITMCEDCYFLIKILTENNLCILYDNFVGYNYVQNLNSATNSLNKLFENEEVKYIQTMELIRRDCKLSESLEYDVNAACVKLSIDICNILLENNEFEPSQYKNRKKYLINYIKKNYKEFFINRKISIKYKIRSILTLIRIIIYSSRLKL
ncbi:glycosyltransferase family 2 protein [Clostridium butyricum]|uniref:glycosyltransferase family 2 protein n=1 Tax=Clostridium butyricum TaxID=1492 RepID=UPI003D32FDDE